MYYSKEQWVSLTTGTQLKQNYFNTTTNTPGQTKKKWITFNYHSPLIHKITNLFKHTNLHTAFRTSNTILKHLRHQPNNNTLIASGIYGSQCETYVKSYVGQTPVRHCEHTRYMKSNNPLSSYAMHILNNQHEYGNPEYTLQLLQPCQKGKFMNCWKSLSLPTMQQKHLIDEQRTNDSDPLHTLANMSHHNTQFQNSSVDTRHEQPFQQHDESIIYIKTYKPYRDQ